MHPPDPCETFPGVLRVEPESLGAATGGRYLNRLVIRKFRYTQAGWDLQKPEEHLRGQAFGHGQGECCGRWTKWVLERWMGDVWEG